MIDEAPRRDPYSQEAEQAVLGAMLIKPELIDILSADLKASDFYFSDNRAVFKAIMEMRAKNADIDFLTVGEHIGMLADDTPAFAYTAELHRNTPSAANAKTYAATVLDRAVERALISSVYAIQEIVSSEASTQDKISQAQAEIMAISSGSGEDETISAGEAARQHVAELERREALGGAIDGLSTGIPSLDKKIGGLKGGGLYIIAGRPKMGKTTLAMNISDNVAMVQQKQSLVCSIEMSHKQLMDKTIASTSGIPLGSLKDGSVLKTHPTQLLEAVAKIDASGLKLYDRKGLTINRLRSVARRHKMRHGLDLLVVDHIGLVDVDDVRAGPVQRVSEVTRQLKLLAQELDVPVLAMSQLNRELEKRPNKRPIPSDLRDSGTIEQDADMIIFVYRDEVYEQHTDDRGIAEIIIGVARDIEPCTVRVRYQGKYSLFSDLTAAYEPPEPKAQDRAYSSKSLLD